MASKKVVEYTGADVEVTAKKQAVNILDLLLGSDIGEIKLPTKQVEISRLSNIYGSPFIVTCKALTPDKYEEVQDMAVNVQSKDVDLDLNLLQMFVVIEGVCDAEENPMFKNKDLMTKFKVPTPKELVKKLLLSGEIASLYGEISELSGFGEDSISEVKN